MATKVQRIKLRLYKHPVKMDASITAMDVGGSWVDVVFDGPMPACRLWKYSDSLLIDNENVNSPPQGCRLFEVL